MVQINITALLAIAIGAASVAGAAVRNLDIEARSAELAALIESRDLAYLDYEARELELSEHTRELEARGYDTEDLLFERINAAFKTEILAWLKQAHGAAQFGGIWSPMHSAGTSVAPHCRPYGLEKKMMVDGPKKGNKTTKVERKEYWVKLDCAPNSKKPDSKQKIVSAFLVGTGTPPSTASVYARLTAEVEAL